MELKQVAGNDEYLYDQTNNTLHYCKFINEKCNIRHLTPTNSYLIPSYGGDPELTVVNQSRKTPVICPHCFKR